MLSKCSFRYGIGNFFHSYSSNQLWSPYNGRFFPLLISHNAIIFLFLFEPELVEGKSPAKTLALAVEGVPSLPHKPFAFVEQLET